MVAVQTIFSVYNRPASWFENVVWGGVGIQCARSLGNAHLSTQGACCSEQSYWHNWSLASPGGCWANGKCFFGYLLDRYKEKKEWNSKQSGGQLRKNPHYDVIDLVMGCREAKKRMMRSYQKMKRMVISQLENCRFKRRERKKRRRNTAAKDALSTVSEQGQKLTSVIEQVQQSQSEQLKCMTQFMSLVAEMMKTSLRK